MSKVGKLGFVLAAFFSVLVLQSSEVVPGCASYRELPTAWPIDGGLRISSLPSQPAVGQTVIFNLTVDVSVVALSPFPCIEDRIEENQYQCFIYDYEAKNSEILDSSSWITWTTREVVDSALRRTRHYDVPPVAVSFPYAGRFRLVFTRSCSHITSDLYAQLRGEVVVSVSGGSSSGSLPSPPAPPSTPATPPATPPVQPSTSASPTLPADIFLLGDYRLREVSLLQCASALGRPYTSIIVTTADGKNLVLLQNVTIDSGADRSFFPAWVAEELGIKFTPGSETTSIGVGGETITYEAEVYIAIIHMGGTEKDVQGYILASNGSPLFIKTTAAFSVDSNLCLLGRADVFDALTITFQGDTATVTPAVR